MFSQTNLSLMLMIFFVCLVGCSSMDERDHNSLTFKKLVYTDADKSRKRAGSPDTDLVVIPKRPNLEYLFIQYKESGIISQDTGMSCFNSVVSTNFIGLDLDEVAQFRPYVFQSPLLETNIRKAEVESDGKHTALHYEQKLDSFHVKQKVCWKEHKGKATFIVSEIYQVK